MLNLKQKNVNVFCSSLFSGSALQLDIPPLGLGITNAERIGVSLRFGGLFVFLSRINIPTTTPLSSRRCTADWESQKTSDIYLKTKWIKSGFNIILDFCFLKNIISVCKCDVGCVRQKHNNPLSCCTVSSDRATTNPNSPFMTSSRQSCIDQKVNVFITQLSRFW